MVSDYLNSSSKKRLRFKSILSQFSMFGSNSKFLETFLIIGYISNECETNVERKANGKPKHCGTK